MPRETYRVGEVPIGRVNGYGRRVETVSFLDRAASNAGNMGIAPDFDGIDRPTVAPSFPVQGESSAFLSRSTSP